MIKYLDNWDKGFSKKIQGMKSSYMMEMTLLVPVYAFSPLGVPVLVMVVNTLFTALEMEIKGIGDASEFSPEE